MRRYILICFFFLPFGSSKADWTSVWPVAETRISDDCKPAVNDLLGALSERLKVLQTNLTQTEFSYYELIDLGTRTSSVSVNYYGDTVTNWYRVQTNCYVTNRIETLRNFWPALADYDLRFFGSFGNWVDWTQEGTSWDTYFSTPIRTTNWTWSGSTQWVSTVTTTYPAAFPKFTARSFIDKFPLRYYTNIFSYTWATNQTAALGWQVGVYTSYYSGSTNRVTVGTSCYTGVLLSKGDSNTNIMFANAYYGLHSFTSSLTYPSYPTNLNIPTNLPYSFGATNTDGCPASGEFYFSGIKAWPYVYSTLTNINYFPTYKSTNSNWTAILANSYTFGGGYYISDNPSEANWRPLEGGVGKEIWHVVTIDPDAYYYSFYYMGLSRGLGYVYYYPDGDYFDYSFLGYFDEDIPSLAKIQELGWNFRATEAAFLNTPGEYNSLMGDLSKLSTNCLRGRYIPGSTNFGVNFTEFDVRGIQYNPPYEDEHGNQIPYSFTGNGHVNITVTDTNWFHLTNILTSINGFSNEAYNAIITNLFTEEYNLETNANSFVGDTLEFYWDFPYDLYHHGLSYYYWPYYYSYYHEICAEDFNDRKTALQNLTKFYSPGSYLSQYVTAVKVKQSKSTWGCTNAYKSSKWYPAADFSNTVVSEYQSLWDGQDFKETRITTNYFSSHWEYGDKRFSSQARRSNIGAAIDHDGETETVLYTITSRKYTTPGIYYCYDCEYIFPYGDLSITPVSVWVYAKYSDDIAFSLAQGETSCNGEFGNNRNYILSGFEVNGDDSDAVSSFISLTLDDLDSFIGPVGAWGSDFSAVSNRTSSVYGEDFPNVLGLINPNSAFTFKNE